MNLLLDEQLDGSVADGLNAMSKRHGASFQSIRDLAPGSKDADIPNFCQERGFDALVTANVRDFGAREALYAGLLAAGVSVVVLRPSRSQRLTPEVQLGVLSQHSVSITRKLAEATAPVLLRVNQSGVRERTLEELRDEIHGKGSALP